MSMKEDDGELMLEPKSSGQGTRSSLDVPGIVDDFVHRYVPCTDECHATDVFDMASLRNMMCAWVPFGVSEDPLQAILEHLMWAGYKVVSTSSGPAICVIDKRSDRCIET